jgi:hypothetical protein
VTKPKNLILTIKKKLKIKIKLSLDKNNMTPQQVKRFALESVLISCKICCNNLVSKQSFFCKVFLNNEKKNVLAKPGDALETPPPFINKLTEGLILFLPQLQ